LQARGDSALL